MSERKGPSKSATLYEVGTKKNGNDGNTWIIQKNKNGVKKWVLFKKKVSKKNSIKNLKNNSFSNFTKFDYSVFDVFMTYKSFYELLMHKSLEYKIEFIDYNMPMEISYYKLSQPKKKFKTNGFVIGHLEKNTFIWQYPEQRKMFADIYFETFNEDMNKKVMNSLTKLLMYDRITLPEKYRQIIPYVLSYFFYSKDVNLKNVTRFGNDNITKDFFYVLINIPLDIPLGFSSTQYIFEDLINMKGGNNETNDNFNFTRLIKDDYKYHINKIEF